MSGHLLRFIDPIAAGVVAEGNEPPKHLDPIGPVWSRPTLAMTLVDLPTPAAVVGAFVQAGLLNAVDRSDGLKIADAYKGLVDWALRPELLAQMQLEDDKQRKVDTSWGHGPRR
jgi:hypothetical protein